MRGKFLSENISNKYVTCNLPVQTSSSKQIFAELWAYLEKASNLISKWLEGNSMNSNSDKYYLHRPITREDRI